MRQYFSLYRAVSQREGERGERIDESKNVQTTPTPPAASAIGPCPTVIKIVGHPGTGSLPSTIAPPDHPPIRTRDRLQVWMNATVYVQMFRRRYPVGSDPADAKVASRLIFMAARTLNTVYLHGYSHKYRQGGGSRVRAPLEAEICLTLNGVPLYTALHYHSTIVLI